MTASPSSMCLPGGWTFKRWTYFVGKVNCVFTKGGSYFCPSPLKTNRLNETIRAGLLSE